MLARILMLSGLIMLSSCRSREAVEHESAAQRDKPIFLLARDAQVRGEKARVEKKGENPHNIGYWSVITDTANWPLKIEREGTYSVEVEYSLDPRSAGSEFDIEFGRERISVKPKTTKSWIDFRK